MGGYGSRFAAWLKSENPQPYGSLGNGSAMRVSPCAWFADDRDKIMNYARQSAQCTHNHPDGINGAMAIADFIYTARLGSICVNCRYHIKETIKKNANIKWGYTLEQSCAAIRSSSRFDETCSGTIPLALQCFLESRDFESAIRLAVSIGGDTDTICAITGSIAQAFYGIPDDIKAAALTYLPQKMIDVIHNFMNKIK
jgi:ADP-ribosylglycohydrolase